MTNMQLTGSEQAQERFARAVAGRLSAGLEDLPYHVTERLRAARTQALAQRKPVASVQTASAVSASGNTATLGFGGFGGFGWLRPLFSALPLVVLAGGLFLIHNVQNERRASEVAEVDAALLTDDLPPSAYADPGFVQFVKATKN
jgi:hypothetical protein